MTQAVILDQSLLYLRVIWREEMAAIEAGHQHASPEELAQLKETMRKRADYINKLELEFEKGECFGFAVCHGAMALLGKQDWWEDALLHIHKWKGDPKKLDEEIVLKNAEAGQATTLRKLFELAISYVVHSQSIVKDETKEFFQEDVTQINALSAEHVKKSLPSLAHIQILNNDGMILTVQKSDAVAGHFTKEQMHLLLDKETFQKNICLVCCRGHSVRVSYLGDDSWQMYNPAAAKQARNPGALHVTGTKDKIIDLVFEAQRTQDFIIEAAAMNKDNKIDFSAYLDFMKNDPAALLTVDSIFLMILKTPDMLKMIFELAREPKYKEKLYAQITKIVNEAKYKDDQNILHIMAEMAPEILPAFFELLDQSDTSKPLRSAVAKKLMEKEQEFHQTPLHTMAAFAPDGFTALMNAAAHEQHNDELIHAISQALFIKVGKTNDSTLDYLANSSAIAYCALLKLAGKPHAAPLNIALTKILSEKLNAHILKAPTILPHLLIFMKNNAEAKSLRSLFSEKNPDAAALRMAVSKALPVSYDDQHSVLHIIAKYSPDLIQGVFRFILSDQDKPNTFGFLLTALADQGDGVTGWQMITGNLPHPEQIELVDLLTERLQYLKTPDLIILAQELHRALTDQQSRFRGLCSMSHGLFHSNDYGKSEIWRSLLGKTKEILNNRKESLQTPGMQEIMNIKLG